MMRILLAVLSPLSAELGGAQMAQNLSDALRSLGCDTTVWSPFPVPADVPWYRHMSWIRHRLKCMVEETGPYDVVDVPPVGASAVRGGGRAVVARSIQPEFLYMREDIRARAQDPSVGCVRFLAEIAYRAYLAAHVLGGWVAASYILCLGRLEYDWMSRHMPWWRNKLAMYVSAIGEAERTRLTEIRRTRLRAPGSGTRFLWLGRWTPHKGTRELIEFVRRRATTHPDDSFTFAGVGRSLALDNDLSRLPHVNVRIVPSYTRRDLPELLRTHDAGLFTSTVEGWGLSLQEMLESGMTVYATEAGAASELRAEFLELLRSFPPADAGAGGPPLDPREGYTRRFSWNSIAHDYLDLLDKRTCAKPA